MIRSLACLLALMFVVGCFIYLPSVVAHYRTTMAQLHKGV
jgi:hypothetical protein